MPERTHTHTHSTLFRLSLLSFSQFDEHPRIINIFFLLFLLSRSLSKQNGEWPQKKEEEKTRRHTSLLLLLLRRFLLVETYTYPWMFQCISGTDTFARIDI